MAQRRILVTGATGFIGRPTVAALVDAGCEVHALTRGARAETAFPNGVTPQVHDLLRDDPARLIDAVRPDTLVHLAWETSHGTFWESPVNADWLAASLNLARTFAAKGGRRVMGVGTAYEYDLALAHGGPLAEDAPIRPATAYGRAKADACAAMGRLMAEAGLSFAWARLFHLYGPGEDARRLIPAVSTAIREGRRPVALGPDLRRDYLHSTDAGRALALLALSQMQGAVNVASGTAPTLREIITAVAVALGRPDIRAEERPARPADPPLLLADVTRLAGLGFTPRIRLDAGLRELSGPSGAI